LKTDCSQIESLILILGISGAGKSSAGKVVADMGYYTIENFPVDLLDHLIGLIKKSSKRFLRTALLLDTDNKSEPAALLGSIEKLHSEVKSLKIIFLDCKTEAIIRRYSETRRPHPGFDSSTDRSLEDTIARERTRLQLLKDRAHSVLDTSNLTIHQLKIDLRAILEEIAASPECKLHLNFLSFGFKHGIPRDCDLVIDVRFLQNPHFVERLKPLTGLDPTVSSFVLESNHCQEFLEHYTKLLNFLLPLYIREGKSYLNIGVGCTGGQHRSVAIAQELARGIQSDNVRMSVKHRDIVLKI